MRLNISFFLIVFFPIIAKSNDTLRILTFPKHLQLYTKLGPSYSEVEVLNPDIENIILFEHNPQSTLGFGFSYSWLSMGLSFTLPSPKDDLLLYGKTNKFDFVSHYTMKRSILDLTLKWYKGFYISNPEEYIPDWRKVDPYPRVPDLETVVISISYAYIFKPEKYSSGAAFTFDKAMRKSGGSWMAGSYISINEVSADSSIIPKSIQQYVDPELDLSKITFSNIGASIGYSHLFTIRKKNFISFTILPGLSYQMISQCSSIDGSISESKELALRSIIKFSVGRNGDKFYWGFASHFESSIVKHNGTELYINSGNGEVFFGYRFDTSSWRFMKRVDRIMHPKVLRKILGTPPDRD